MLKAKIDEGSPPAEVHSEFDIAIVGMACRFPGASNVDQFWKNLAEGIESISPLSDSEILESGVPSSLLNNPDYVKAAPVLDDPGSFDAKFFGFSPMEATTMDPQHRILLELAHEALENASCDPDSYEGRIGVFTGAAMNTYFMNAGLNRRFAEDYIPTLIVNDKDFLSTRISYKLNLKGPSITIQTACSTSLVAIHLARQSLLSEETDMALAGAISVRVPHRAGYVCDGGGIVSPDGHVRAFDAKANGTVFGSGGGIVVLKRLDDAIASGDIIHAVIKGSAVNNDGSEKAGYTAPSVNSQADAVVEALANAGVEAESIGYIEAHGSGTPIGDPIEVMALTKAFRTGTRQSGYCALGSVKTNVGHLDAAAGIAAIIKTVLALKHRQIPPTLHYTEANPEIDFPRTPFYVNTSLVSWEADGPRRAGVMSTGMGGTNAHLVLEEAPAPPKTENSSLPHLLVLSAKSETALDAATNRLLEFLQNNLEVNMADVAWTLQTGRKAFPHRRILVCESREDAIAALSEEKSKRIISSHCEQSSRRPVIFMFPGIGDHYLGMGRELYQKSDVFRQEVDRCAEILEPHLGVDIRQIIWPKQSSAQPDLKKMLGAKGEGNQDPAAQKLNQTIYAQPALFTIEYALALLWMHLGISPDAMVGHSMGEYVAACLAGVLSLPHALGLIATRAKLANSLEEGAMLAVLLSETEIVSLLETGVSIALINGPNLCVVAGAAAAVADFEKKLNDLGVISRRVRNTHAFHSRMLDPIVPAFTQEVRKAELKEPAIPFISNVTGKWITKTEAKDPAYWGRHANHTARFSDALHHLWQFKDANLLEIGPGKTLGVLATQHPDRQNAGNAVVLSSLRHSYDNESDLNFLWQNIGRFWLAGGAVDWGKLPGANGRRRIPLPTYPFERENYWLEAIRVSDAANANDSPLQKNADQSKWFYVPSWKRTLPKTINVNDLLKQKSQHWIVFSDGSALTTHIIDQLRTCGQRVITVTLGEAYQQINTENFVLSAGDARHYESLVSALQASDSVPEQVIHGWSLSGSTTDPSETSSFTHAQERGFYSLLFFVRSLAAQNLRSDLNLFVLSDQIQDVQGNEILRPEKSTLLGPCMVIRQEYPNIRLKSIDLEETNQRGSDDLTISQILGECFSSDSELFVAYRNHQRWVQTYEQVELDRKPLNPPVFRECGVYLITGGLGNIGYTISKQLAQNYRAKLILVGRSDLTSEALRNGHSADDSIDEKIRRVTEIENLGGEVLYVAANVDDADDMRRVLDQAHARFGQLHGVIHGAGVVGDGGYCEIKNVDSRHCDMHFQAKALALPVLEQLIAGRDLDFCLLLSSLTSVLGGIGQAAYAASNVYMDTFARRHSRKSGTPWISVNWDVWRLQEQRWGAAGLGKTLAGLGMTADEALNALQTVLVFKHATQLVVSTGDLDARIRQWIKLQSFGGEAFAASTQSSLCERPSLSTTYDAPRDASENTIAEIWQRVLGIKQVGLRDNFSDLGGHSLLAIKIISELRSAFQIDLPVKALFDAPTVAELAAYIKGQNGDKFSPEPLGVDKPNDLLKSLQSTCPDLHAIDAFTLPHWFYQQDCWLQDPENSDTAIYNFPLLLRIRGTLERAALEGALQEIVRRHQVFRSAFQIHNGQAVQVILASADIPLRTIDLSDLSDGAKEAQFEDIVAEEASEPFDLTRGPLLRATLIQLGKKDYALQLTTHHLVHDDWSTGVLSHELSELYQSQVARESSRLQNVTFQYGDYIRWQNEQLGEKVLEKKLAYWKKELSSPSRFQHLTADFARPAKSSNCGSRECIVLSAELSDSLQTLSRTERVSMFMVLLAGFKCLLYRYSNHDEIAVASCGANRSLPEVEGLIGRFGNDMLLRTSLTGNPTFRELLMRVRQTALTAYSAQDIPFGALLKSAANGSTPNSVPPFQVMFILQNAPKQNSEIAGLDMTWSSLYTGTAKFDLSVWLKIDPALEIILEYSTDLFRAATMQRILNDYTAVLAAMVQNPAMRVQDVRLLGMPEQAKARATPPAIPVPRPVFNGAPASETQTRLITLWEHAFRKQPIAVDQDFFELGGDSLLAARLFPQIEKAFQIELPLAALLEAPTIRQLARKIECRGSDSLGSCLVAIQAAGTKSPLFCVHGHMGEVFFCRNLANALGSDQPVYGLRAQGVAGNAPHYSVEEMAAHYLREIVTVQPTGPYFLAGYCFGGMVAYEMARMLRSQSEEVGLLVMFNTPAPGSLDGWLLDYAYLARRIRHELKKLRALRLREKLVFFGDKASGLAALVFGSLKATLWHALAKSSIKSAEQVQHLLSVPEINVSATKAYNPARYSGQIVLFLTEEAPSLYAIDPKDGWSALTADGVEVHSAAGDNMSMFDAKSIDALAEKLQACLNRAEARTKDSTQLPSHSVVSSSPDRATLASR